MMLLLFITVIACSSPSDEPPTPTPSDTLTELIRAVDVDDGVCARTPPNIDWPARIDLDVMEQAIKTWYADREVHPYLEFDCSHREEPTWTAGCYGTQDTLGDEIVAFSYMEQADNGVVSVQHEYAHQTDFVAPAKYVIYKATFGEDYKVSVIMNVRRPGGFDRTEATRASWMGQ